MPQNLARKKGTPMIAIIKRAFWFLVWCVIRAYAEFRPQRTIILDGKRYMVRYFLTSTPEGDATGTPGTYLHHIRCADVDRRVHNHPWEWANTRILRGGYVERREWPGERISGFIFSRKPGDRAALTPNVYHRITYVEPNTWTLFRAGPKHGRGWGFK
jgi:hypothetical protein